MVELLFFLIMVFLVALISRKIDKLPISAQMIFIFAGIAAGYFLTGFVDVREPPVSTIVLIIAEVALVLVLFTDASRVKLGALKSNLLTLRVIKYRTNIHHSPGNSGRSGNIH